MCGRRGPPHQGAGLQRGRAGVRHQGARDAPSHHRHRPHGCCHTPIPALPFCHVHLHAQRPRDQRYPHVVVTIGDALLKARLNRGMTRKAAARLLKVNKGSLENWEKGRRNPEGRFYPTLIAFVGYNPLPVPRTRGEAVRRERLARGLSQDRLVRLAGVDPATVSRPEADTLRMARMPVEAILRTLGTR